MLKNIIQYNIDLINIIIQHDFCYDWKQRHDGALNIIADCSIKKCEKC